MAVKNADAINSIKMLTLDINNGANINDGGYAYNLVPILYSIYNNINVIPSKPNWLNRDRFIFSLKKGSAALYSTLYAFGYDYSIEDLKRYADIDSFTPYNPELNVQLGIECTCGLNGEAIGNGVGLALSERYFQNICKNISQKTELINYKTFILCDESDLQSGVSYEAISFACDQKLNNFVIICLSNPNDTMYEEDLETRFEDLDFNVINIKNHNNISSLDSALKDANKSKEPTLIIVSMDLKDDNDISKEAMLLEKQKNNISLKPFDFSENIRNFVINNINNRMNKRFVKWQSDYDLALSSRDNHLISTLRLIENGEFVIDFDSANYQINEKYSEEGIFSNKKVINFIAPKTRFFLGGSAGNSKNTKSIIEKDSMMTFEDALGRNIEFGHRERMMGAVLNGMALNNLRVYGANYLAMADLMMPSIRMSSMMNLPVTYIFTHDSASLGINGPVYETSNQISMLRSIPNLTLFRPADINEIIGSWEYILKNHQASALVINNENTHILKHTNGKYVKYGAYIVRKEKYHLDGIIIASGTEVSAALKIAEELFTEGIDLRIVSMPSIELFLKQNPIYEEKLLPKDVLTITLEFGSPIAWNRFASNEKCAIGINNFGTTGKNADVLKFMEFDYNSLLMKIKNIFEKE